MNSVWSLKEVGRISKNGVCVRKRERKKETETERGKKEKRRVRKAEQ